MLKGIIMVLITVIENNVWTLLYFILKYLRILMAISFYAGGKKDYNILKMVKIVEEIMGVHFTIFETVKI